MRTGFLKPFFAALAGSVALLVALFVMNSLQPSATVVQAAPVVAAHSLAATEVTTVTLNHAPETPEYTKEFDLALVRTDQISPYVEMSATLIINDKVYTETVGEAFVWELPAEKEVVTRTMTADMPESENVPPWWGPGTNSITATIMQSGTVVGQIGYKFDIKPHINFDSSIRGKTFKIGEPFTLTAYIEPALKEENIITDTTEKIVFDMKEDGKDPIEVTAGVSTTYTKEDKDNRTYVFTTTMYMYDNMPAEGNVYTPTITYKSGIYEDIEATAWTTVTVADECPDELILTTDGSSTTSVALGRASEGKMIPQVGEAPLQVEALKDGNPWDPGDKTVFFTLDTTFGKGSMDKNPYQGDGKFTGSLEAAITGQGVVTAKYCGVQSNPVTVTFTRDEAAQGVYEALVKPGQGAVTKQMPASSAALAALTDQDKNIGTAEIPDNVYDEDVVVRFVAFPGDQFDTTVIPTTTRVFGNFAVEFFFADGASLNPILEEGYTFPSPIKLTYDVPSAEELGVSGIENPRTVFWNDAQQKWATAPGLEDVSATTSTVVVNLKQYGEFAKLTDVITDGDDFEVYDPAVGLTATFDDLTIEIPAGAYPGGGLRIKITPVEGGNQPEGVPELKGPTVRQVFKYYQVVITDLEGNPINNIQFTRTQNVNVTIEFVTETALQAPVTVPATATQLLRVGSYTGNWSSQPANVSGNTMSVQLTSLGDALASLTASREVYLPLIAQMTATSPTTSTVGF